MNDRTPVPVYVETPPGLEEVAWLEIRDRFPEASFGALLFARDERGVVVFDFPGDLAALFALRTVNGAFLTAAFLDKDEVSRGYRDLHRMREQMAEAGNLGRAVNLFTRFRRRQPSTYRVVVRTYGRHEYDRRDVRRAVLQVVEPLYPEWQRTPEEADLELWANVFGSNILVGLRLPGRFPERAADDDGVQPEITAALVHLTGAEAADRFLDPLCGAGGVLAERAAVTPGRLLLGGDEEAGLVRAARGRAGTRATVCRWQGAALPLATASVDKVATHLPAAPEKGMGDRYDAWLGEMARVLRPGGEAVVLTLAYELFKSSIRNYPELRILGGYSVAVGGRWGRIYTLRRD